MFKNLLKKNVELVTKKPKIVLLVALVVTIIAGVLASNLSMDLNWVALAPKGSSSVQEYKEILEEFPSLNNIVVLIESDDREMLEKVALETEEKVNKIDEYVSSVISGVDRDFMIKNVLLYMSKEEIEMMGSVFTDTNVDKIYSYMYLMMDESIKAIEEGDLSKGELKYSVSTFDAMSEFMLQTKNSIENNSDDKAIDDALETLFVGSSLITSPDGKMTMLTIQPNFDIMDMEKIIPGVNTIEDVLKSINEKYENVSVKATGMHIVARDETASLESDSYFTTLLSLILILSMLYFAFRSWIAPVFAFVPLSFGIVWSMGIMGITIGRLNMMTVFSVAMLLGLGIDYAIHMYSSYTEKRSIGVGKNEAIKAAITLTGPSIIIGALTTALAFFALNISQLPLLKELGTAMGTGIITTLVSVFWVLPALIVLKKEKDYKMQKIKGNYPAIGSIAKAVHKVRYVVLVVIVAGAVFMGFKAKNIKFDMNLMNLEPAGLESVELMEYMVEKYDTSSDSFTIQVDSLDEVYRLHEEFENVENVSEVMSIASVIPKEDVQQEKLETIEDIKEFLKDNKSDIRIIDKETLKASVVMLNDKLDEYKDAWIDADLGILNDEDFLNTQTTLNEIEVLLNGDVDDELLEVLSTTVYTAMGDIEEVMFTDETLDVSDLPYAYKSQFVSEDSNKFMISVYPSFDIWSNLGTEKGEKFLNDLADVEESITGTPIFMKDLYDAVGEEIALTGTVLLLILLAILLLHFRSIKYAFLAFLPLSFTLIYMVGTMALLSIDFNMLNFLAILLIIGIGLDDGVHILHHYKEGERNIKKLFSSIGRAILLTTVTTVFGFGSLGFSSYRGIAGLGIVLAIGVTLALVFTVLVLPIFLKDEKVINEVNE